MNHATRSDHPFVSHHLVIARQPPPRGRDHDVIARVAKYHDATLRRIALRLTGNESDARDLIQSALERALSRAAPIGTEKELIAWLGVVMRNLAFDIYRARRRQQAVPLEEQLELALSTQVANEKASGAARPDWLDIHEREVNAAIEDLDPRLRDAVRAQQKGLTLLEISRATGIPAATIGTRIHRARRRLRSLLESSSDGVVALRGAPQLKRAS